MVDMMPIEEDPDINLSIPLKPIYEEFLCPVCFENLKECRITPCGHNFCKECIEESLNRKHQCPCCNAPATINTLVSNKLMDRLMSIVDREKDKASKDYFERLINSNVNHTNSHSEENVNVASLSPIEQLFHKHMKKSLINYQDYYKTLEDNSKEKMKTIRERFTKKMIRYQKKSNKENVDNDPKILDYKSKCDEEIKGIEDSFEKATALLLQSYEQYLLNIDPAPQFLPVTVSIQIPDRNVDIKNIRLDRTSNVNDLRNIVKDHMESIGDPVHEFGNANVFVLYPSFSSSNEKKRSRNDGIIIADEGVPILQHNPEPGALLILKGKLVCKSDAPKKCFKATFKTGDKMDYFSCSDCKMNWICKPCITECHRGHNIKEYILDHGATWACCYCVKNKRCKIFN